ncbi:MAG: LamG-like jellyroll fold domain-containing protein, partial [Nitrosopumilus sp.]
LDTGLNATSTELLDTGLNATSTELLDTGLNATSTELLDTVEPELTPEIIVPDATISLQFDNIESESISENDTSTEDQTEKETLKLSGENDFIQIEDLTVTNDLDGLTITVWVKPDYSAGSSEFTIISKEKSFSLSINNNILPEKTAKFSVFDGIKWTTIESTSTIPEQWTFLSATFDGETISIYVDATKEGTIEIVGVPTLSIRGELEITAVESITSEEDIVIGATITTKSKISTSNLFSGEIDDVLLYDYVLDDEQIRAIYEQTKDLHAELDNVEELSIEEIIAQMTIEQEQIDTGVHATSTELLDTGLNATSTELLGVNETIIEPVEPVELTVEPILTSTKETYLISEDVVLDLEFYNEYDVLMNELAELDNALQLLTIDVNQTLQETTISLDSASVNQTSSNPVLNFINILFFIPEANAANLNDEDASKIEIENTIAEIIKLKEQLNALKEDPNLTEEEIKAAKAQLKKVIQQIKLTASQVSKTDLKDEGAKLDKLADDIEKIGGVEPEALIQTESWVGIDETIVGEVYDSEGNLIPLKINYEKLRDGKFNIIVEFDKDTKPGLYKLKTTLTVNGQTFVSESEFAWGLVSLNTVKSIYKPGETAEFVIVVLDNEGHPVSNANLVMMITAPNSEITNLSLGNGITANEESGLYDAEYTTSVEGTYLVDINAQTEGINTDFSTTFDVAGFFEFDIIRTAQSKIDPITNPNSFDVRIDIESFVGGQSLEIKETVPSVFDVVTDASVQAVGDTKILTWNKQLIEDKTYVEYSYSIPLEFPQLYALGPIEINYGDLQTFTEARPWFVAADPQFATPDGDVDTTGWLEGASLDGDGSLFNEIDDAVADGDTTYVFTTIASYFEVSLSNVDDPNSNADHIIHVNATVFNFGGPLERITLALFEGGEQRAVSANASPPLPSVNRGSYTELTYELSAAEADSITDYADLSI